MNRVKTQPDQVTPEIKEYLKRVEYDFQVREFGEEMARINFLPPVERRRQIAALVNHARRKDVKFEKPARGITS